MKKDSCRGKNKIRNCPLCKNSNSNREIGTVFPTKKFQKEPEDFFKKDLGHFSLIDCVSCKLIYLNPLPPKSVFDRLYVNNIQFLGPSYTGERIQAVIDYYKGRFLEIRSQIFNNTNDLRILEAGAGLSWVSRVAKLADLNIYTVAQDITPQCENSTPWVDKWVVGEINLNKKKIGTKGSFDIISITHVIEHLPKLLLDMETLAELLAKNGIFFITTPHRPEGWNGDINLWRKWSYNHCPDHVQYFNKESFDFLAKELKLKIIFYSADSENGQSLETWLQKI